MNDSNNFMTPSISAPVLAPVSPSMPPLPAPLAHALAAGGSGLGKRERTRRQLLEAAIRVISARGAAGATIGEIAAVAGMTTGTVYNHFRTKEEVVQALALWLGETLCRAITASQAGIREGAERMAIGIRRYIWLAEQSPPWAVLMMEVAIAAPALVAEISAYALADLRMGIKQKSFRVPSEAAAMNLINGTVLQAMQSVALGAAGAGHGSAVAAVMLRGLGLDFDAATEVSRRPLPDLPGPAVARPATAAPAKLAPPKAPPAKVAPPKAPRRG